MDLQEAIERFLTDTERRRSDVTARRFKEAMDLLQTFLAVRLLDPESSAPSRKEKLEDLTPAVMRAFLGEFLVERLRGNERAKRRYHAATRAFVQWLARGQLLPASEVLEILSALREEPQPPPPVEEALEQGGRDGGASGERAKVLEMAPGPGPDGSTEEQFFQVMEIKRDRLVLLDVETSLEVQGERPEHERLEPGDLVAGRLVRRRGRLWVSSVRLVAEQDLEGDDLSDDEWDEDILEDDDAWVEAAPLVEDALEILASEDRYAPREVVRVILANMEEARDDLLDWLTDEDFRNEPLPGAGEAPANAARLLAEVRDPDALPRLLEVLGDTDPLGEEAPGALGRYGAAALGPLRGVIEDGEVAQPRRQAAVRALAHLAARNPAMRKPICDLLVSQLVQAQAPVVEVALEALEDLRALEALDSVLALAAEGALDLEAHERTSELFASRVLDEGWGKGVIESLLPVIYLYPSNEELEEFYASLEEDLGDLWDLMNMDADGDLPKEPDGDVNLDESDDPASGGKVIPFRRPPG
ncbi:MAG: hypothetical protein RBU30_17455 [Polyangia bacterium]|jgi:hypothetical protein|nr:hypothetical protein [Polyangia bacterium]